MARILWLLILLCAACNFVASPSPTSTPADPPTQTPTETLSPTSTLALTLTPTSTPTATESPTITPTFTITPTLTPAAPPTTTPRPVVGFLYDNWERFDGSGILNQLSAGMVAFVNFNNRENVSGTPQPVNDTQTLYFVNPLTPGAPIPVAVTTGATGDQIYIAPSGDAVAYLRPAGSVQESGEFRPSGLYVIDMQIGIDGRVLPITSLIQQNIFSPPVWSPDGARLAIALDSGYDLDIYAIGRDGSNPVNLTPHGAFDFYPAWSPDGRYLAFLSDRNTCPSWRPGEPGTCDGTGALPPFGGNVFVLDTVTGAVIQVGEQYVTEQPIFINARTVAYAVGDPILGDQGRAIWMGDIISGTEAPLQSVGANDLVKLSETFAPTGGLVFYQSASDTSTELVVTTVDGREVGRSNAFTFSRYGIAADFSPDGSRIAIGGRDGQCPYGALVLTSTLNVVTAASPPPSMCEPQYSPDGRYIAYTGINPRVDGRVDVYVANSNGAYIGNLTSGLRGQILLLGWAGR